MNTKAAVVFRNCSSNDDQWIYDNNDNTILIGINPSNSKIEFPATIKTINPQNESLIQNCKTSIREISFEANSQLTFLGNFTFAFCSTLETANLSNCLLLESLSACLFQNSKITSVILPENGKLKTICCGCFRSTSLTYVKIPDTVTQFKTYENSFGGIFDSCSSLLEINISKTSQLTYIGYAIAQYSKIVSFYIPPLVTTIISGAFSEIRTLEHIIVDENNKQFSSDDDIVYMNNGKTLHTCAANKKSPISIPNDITDIYNEAFRACRHNCEIKIPELITTIRINTFLNSLFSSIILPQKLEIIQSHGFRSTQIRSIVIPRSVTEIQTYAFLNSKIQHLYFQYYQQSISLEDYAFQGCIYLVSIHIPSKMVGFESNLVFDGCFSLKEVYYIVSPLTYYASIFGNNVTYNVHLHGLSKENDKIDIYSCGNIRNVYLSNNLCHIHTCPKPTLMQLHFSYFVFLFVFLSK